MSVTNEASTSPNTVTIEIAGMDVTIPVRFAPGQVLSENDAKVLDAAYQRQFTNNQNALAKSRAEAYAKATTDAERAAKAPLTASQIAALYTDYKPNVGGTPRQSAMEKIKQDAAWRFWTAHVKAHNDSIANGGKPVIAKAGTKPVSLPKAFKTAEGVTVTVQEQKDNLTTRLLALPAYADSIQGYIDAIMAERGTKKTETVADSVAIGADDLL